MHARVLKGAAAFAVIAGGAGCYHIAPGVPAAHMAWDDVVNREIHGVFSAILAGVAITPENLPPGEPDNLPGMHYHVREADNGRTGEHVGDRTDFAATIEHQRSFLGENQPNRPAQVADVERFKIGIENQHCF